jgi:putative nucleotidyltransferase with HDIG domain
MSTRSWARTGSTPFVPSAPRLHAGGLSATIERGQALEHHGQREDARRLYEWALRDGTATNSTEAAQLLRLIARAYMNDADFASAVDCATAALAVAEQSGHEAGRGHALNILASVEWMQGKHDNAERLYLLARQSADQSGESLLAAMTSSNLGVIANVRGEERKAREYYEASLTHARGAGRADQAIAALGNLGQLNTQAGHLEAANRHLAEAHELASVIGDRSMLITIELLTAKLRIKQGDLSGARDACQRTRGIIDQIGDSREAGDAEFVYGIVARASGDGAAAEKHFLRAEELGIGRQDLILQGEIARELSELYRSQGRNRQTLQRLNHAHRLFSQLRARRELADVDRRTAKLENEFLDVVRKWGESIESKDVYTQGHCVRVADLACALWMKVNTGDDTSLFWFRIGALLHDVGKLMVPAEVLNKPGKLSDEEWAMVRNHPSAGVELLADIEFPWDVRPIVESHHERWDGKGYPRGLAGEAIPLTARVLCVADVYDALTSVRSYKRAFTHDEAMDIMRKDAGTQFDPALFAAFEEVMRGTVPESTVNRPKLALIA